MTMIQFKNTSVSTKSRSPHLWPPGRRIKRLGISTSLTYATIQQPSIATGLQVDYVSLQGFVGDI